MRMTHWMLPALLVISACRPEMQNGAEPVPPPPRPRIQLVLSADTGHMVTASLQVADGAPPKVGALTMTVAYEAAVLTPAGWSGPSGATVLGRDDGQAVHLVAIAADGLPDMLQLATLRFSWPSYRPGAAPPLRLTVDELTDVHGTSLLPAVQVDRSVTWR